MSWGTIFVFWIIWVVLGIVIANHKNLSMGLAVGLTVILGLIGVIILLCLPSEPKGVPGMYAVRCVKCGAPQNVPQPEFTCWQCHTPQSLGGPTWNSGFAPKA